MVLPVFPSPFLPKFPFIFCTFLPVFSHCYFSAAKFAQPGFAIGTPGFFRLVVLFSGFPEIRTLPCPRFWSLRVQIRQMPLFSAPKKRKGAPGRTGGLWARQLRSGTPGGMLQLLKYPPLPCPFGWGGRFCGHAAGVCSVPSPLFTSPRVLPGSLVTPYSHSTSVGMSSLSASTGWSASRKCSFSRAATASRSSA